MTDRHTPIAPKVANVESWGSLGVFAFLVVIHVIVCIALILVVLLQTGKGADMGAAFGGGSSQTVFGSTGASTFLKKVTTGAAIAFMLTCLTLAYMSGNRTPKSIVTEAAPVTSTAAPIQKAPAASERPVTAHKSAEPATAAPATGTPAQK